MRPLADLSADVARSLRGVIFDLDDTLLDHQRLMERAYGALFRLREAGLRLVACTGRPSGWAEVIARQWPIDAAIAENGAIAMTLETTAEGKDRLRVDDPVDATERLRRRDFLVRLAADVRARYPLLELADDNGARRSDVTFDIGEFRRIAPATVDEVIRFAESSGARTFRSSVHLHLTLDTDDKGSGALRLLSAKFREDPAIARGRYAFVGDSENDAVGFSTFAVSVGVANVARAARRLTMPPRFVTPSPMGAGFAELASHLVSLRG